MSLVGNLIGFGLRQALGVDVTEAIEFIERRFTDQSQALPKALGRANERAWQALSFALAGDSLFDQLKGLVKPAEENAFREQVRDFLADSAIRYDGTPADFRKKCLTELNKARRAGLLAPRGLNARKMAAFERYADPTGLVNGAWQAVARLAEELKPHCPNLAVLICQRPPAGPPLLIAAFAYFFRREVETNPELAHGLFFDGLRQLSAIHANAFAQINRTLVALDGRFDAVLEKLGGIEAKVDAVHGAVLKNAAVAVEVRGDVQDVKAEQQRQGQKLQELVQAVHSALAHHHLDRRPLRSQDSLSIRNDAERQLIKDVVARYRALPEEQRRRSPDLLLGVGKLEVVAGDFAAAQKDFQRLTTLVSDPKAQAEAHYNAYRAALERRQWSEALRELVAAVKLDPKTFASFPMGKYAPLRILGAGGFGVAFLCRHKYMDAQVVVKALQTDDLDRDVDKVFAEAQALRQLDHPAIVRLQDCGYINPAAKSRPYLVMDYFEGTTLEEYVRVHGPLDVAATLAIARQTAEALQAAHAQGILHRDVKPGNLLIRREGTGWQVRLIDFGLAVRHKSVQSTVQQAGTRQRTITANSIAGTLDYAPPEQLGRLTGISAAPCSDVYGFAKTCCYALFQTPQPTFQHWKQIPEPLAVLLGECLAETPTGRPTDFTKVLQRLPEVNWPSPVQKKQPVSPEPPPGPSTDDRDLDSDLQELQRLTRSGRPRKDYIEKMASSRFRIWYSAARAGSPLGQYLLGACLREGIGVAKDDSKAVGWFRKSAEQDHPWGQTLLGLMYFEGRGVANDDVQAVHWFRKAAEKGDPGAQVMLGAMYSDGRGVSQDHAQAVSWYRKVAEQGNAHAQALLGTAYSQGRGEVQDSAQAVHWWRKAAERGHADAQRYLGEAYQEGVGVPRDFAQAMNWYRKAAEQGHKTAQNNLGWMYFEGRGVAQDDAQAVHWYRKAAEQGDEFAQTNLGWMYELGRGVALDSAQAVHWYRKAAEQGSADAQDNLGYAYNQGRGIPQDHAQAVYWWRKAAEKGHAKAQCNLAVMYCKGLGVPQNYAQAVDSFRKAAEQGNAQAQINLAWMYCEGSGVPQDDGQAVDWFRKAAEQGDVDAQNKLGLAYSEGRGVQQDYAQAVYWWRKAAEQGHADAQNDLGLAYHDFRGVQQDDSQAVYWWRKAAEQGHADAQNNLGVMYEQGLGVRQDSAQALHWYQKAAEQGHEKAQDNLDQIVQ